MSIIAIIYAVAALKWKQAGKFWNDLTYAPLSTNADGSNHLCSGAPTIVSAGGALGFKLTCNKEHGAFLILNAPASSIFVFGKRHPLTYMRQHFDSWLNLANDRHGLGLTQDDLIFVTGTTLTSAWFNAAFQGNSARDVEFNVNCDLGNLAGTNISYQSHNEVSISPKYQWGPTQDHPNRAEPTRASTLR